MMNAATFMLQHLILRPRVAERGIKKESMCVLYVCKLIEMSNPMATVTAGEFENGLNDLKTHFDNALLRTNRRIIKEVNESYNDMVDVVEVSN